MSKLLDSFGAFLFVSPAEHRTQCVPLPQVAQEFRGYGSKVIALCEGQFLHLNHLFVTFDHFKS